MVLVSTNVRLIKILLKVNFPASVLKIYKEAFKDSANFVTAEGLDKARFDAMNPGENVFVGTKLEEAFK